MAEQEGNADLVKYFFYLWQQTGKGDEGLLHLHAGKSRAPHLSSRYKTCTTQKKYYKVLLSQSLLLMQSHIEYPGGLVVSEAVS